MTIKAIAHSFEKHSKKLAFQIKDQSYSYAQWLCYITSIRQALKKLQPKTPFIGLAVYDDIQTYASILALWAEGYAFVPLSPLSPASRNLKTLEQVDSSFIMSSRGEDPSLVHWKNIECISTDIPLIDATPLDFSHLKLNQILCVLFTSGSTGAPKGVPYTLQNINSTLDAFFNFDYDLKSSDRFLQMFELTFDMSMLSYLPAWCIGASVHTVDNGGIKYLNAFKVLQSREITFAAMVPSTLKLLESYFNQINLPNLRYCMLGGEPFYVQLASKWMSCIPNAHLINISGPCETTMACMGYELNRDFSKNKSFKNILAFGRPWKNTTAIIVDIDGNIVPTGTEGELCFAGTHVMQGYWKMPDKNKTIFFNKKINGKPYRFYRSGDMAFQDKAGIFYSCGRKDIQYKIQGFKVELGDIEQHAQDFIAFGNTAAVVLQNDKELLDIHLFIDQSDINIDHLYDHLKTHLPSYMLPRSIQCLKKFPQTISGKLDRSALRNIALGKDFDWQSDQIIAERIESCIFDTYQEVAKTINKPIWQMDDLKGLNITESPWPSTIFGSPAIEQINEVLNQIHNKQLPPRWILKRSENPGPLYKKISSTGFKFMVSWPGMAIRIYDQQFPQVDQDIRIIKKEAVLKDWCKIVNKVLFTRIPLDWGLIRQLLSNPQFIFYGLYQNNELATIALGHAFKKIYGIYMVSTLEKFRRQGLAEKLMYHMLSHAETLGCLTACLQASKMGEPMYHKIGFKTFCHFDIFWLLDAEENQQAANQVNAL